MGGEEEGGGRRKQEGRKEAEGGSSCCEHWAEDAFDIEAPGQLSIQQQILGHYKRNWSKHFLISRKAAGRCR